MGCRILSICLLALCGFAGVCAQKQASIWLKAEDVIVGSSLWPDAGPDGVKTATSATFEYGELLNFNPSVSFNTLVDSILLDLDIKDAEHITAFVVFKNDTLEGEKAIWGSTSKTDRELLVSNLNLYDEFNRFEYSFGTMPYPVVAAVSKYWERSVDSKKVQLFLGGRPASFDKRFKGDLAEFILFNRPLSEQEYGIVQTYLALKYGIGVLQTNYINPKGEVIWSAEENKDFSTGIFGLGRYDSYGFHQKQARDSYGVLSMCVNGFFETNSQNSGSLMRDSYIIASNNGQEPDFDISVSDGQFGSKLLNACKWKIQASGTSLRRSAVMLGVNRYELFPDSIADVCMLIDQSSRGDFSAFERVFPTTVDQDGNMIFKDIPWGSDALSTAVFTFALTSGIDLELRYQSASCSNEPVKIFGTILGDGAPYRAKVFDENDMLVEEQVFEQQSFELSLDKLGNYLLEIRDRNKNIVRQRSGEQLIAYSAPRVLDLDYWIVDQPIDIVAASPSGVDIVAYNWFFNNTPVSDDSYLTADKAGGYTLIYTTSGGCLLEESFYVFDKREDSGSGGEHATLLDESWILENEVKVFPNPLKGKDFYISFNNELPSELDLEIYSMDGVLIHKEKLFDIQKQVYTGELNNSGVYMLIVKINGELVYKTKLVRL